MVQFVEDLSHHKHGSKQGSHVLGYPMLKNFPSIHSVQLSALESHHTHEESHALHIGSPPFSFPQKVLGQFTKHVDSYKYVSYLHVVHYAI